MTTHPEKTQDEIRAELIESLGFNLESNQIDQRPDGLMDSDMYHYCCTLSRNGRNMRIYYSMGRAYVEKLPRSKAPYYCTPKDYAKCKPPGMNRMVYLEELAANLYRPKSPELTDILYSLVIDSYALESSGFEDWCDMYGYDTDSRKAEKIYRTCLDQSLAFRQFIGGEPVLEKLREAFQDY